MEEKGFLKEVKKVIHSLVVSTPGRITVQQLRRDYKNQEGIDVPYSKLGYQNIEIFLRSIPDVVVLVGCGPMAQVLARTSAKSAHIQNLVQFQKKPSNRQNHRMKPRFGFCSEKSNLVFVNEQTMRRNNNQSSNYELQCSARNVNNYNTRKFGLPVMPQRHIRSETNNTIDSLERLKISPMGEPLKVNNLKSIENQIVHQPESKMPVNEYESSTNVKSSKNSKVEQPMVEQSKSKLPEQVSSSNEISLSNATVEQSKFEQSKSTVSFNEYVSSDAGADADAIPKFAVDERVLSVDYPKNTVQFNQQLPKRKTNEKFILNHTIEVQVVSVSSPHSFNFWTHFEDYEKYRSMFQNMQQFYRMIDHKRYSIPLFLIMAGHLGVIQYNNGTWERCQVVNFKPEDTKSIEVELVDTGSRVWICHEELKFLDKEFATLPGQYWSGRLAYVMPEYGSHFSANAIIHFYELVKYRRLFARIEEMGADNTFAMVLVDPEANKDSKNINLVLIESGCARRCFNT